jgi:hypothetical protein
MSILMLQTTVEGVVMALQDAKVQGTTALCELLKKLTHANPDIPSCGGQRLVQLCEDDAKKVQTCWLPIKAQLQGGAQDLIQVWL